MHLFIINFILISLLFCKPIEDGWKGMKPLLTLRSDVEKLIGSSKVKGRDYYYYDYETEDAYIEMNYSTSPCKEDQYSRGKFNVAENMLLDYSVILKQRTKISEFEFDRKKYVRLSGGHVLNSGTYQNVKDGVDILVSIERDGTELVQKIYFRPSKKDAEKFMCKYQ